MCEYEVKFEIINILTNKHEIKYDYFISEDKDDVKRQLYWKYGSLLDIEHIIER